MFGELDSTQINEQFLAGVGLGKFIKLYTYEVPKNMRVGDLVSVPPTPLVPYRQTATIVLVGSDFNGAPIKRAEPYNPQVQEIPF